MDVYKEIRRLQLEGVTSQRGAAKRLGISRNTVKKYWEGANVPWDHKPYNRDSTVMTPEVVQFVQGCLDEDDAVNIKKQRHTARRIYQRLVEERGFSGSESSVRKLVHDMKAARKISQVFIPLRFAPGDAVQIDWGEATVFMDGEKEKVNLFCARLCHSCAPYVVAYKRQNLESFLDAIIRTFQYFGGVPRRLIFDNARVAVIIENKLDDSGKDVVWQAPKYVSYCATLTKSEIAEVFQRYLGASGIASDRIVGFFDAQDYESVRLNPVEGDQRIILVAANFRKEVTSTVLWLRNYHDVDISCIKGTPYKDGEKLYAGRKISHLMKMKR